MAQFELVMPKMGESVAEATIIKWLKKPGDSIELDEPVLEIATDKVDSEIPSPVAGILEKILFDEGQTILVNGVIAIINTSAEASAPSSAPAPVAAAKAPEVVAASAPASSVVESIGSKSESGRFYSPLVRNIAKEEKISMQELDAIPGTGKEGRVTKDDLMNWLSNRKPGQTSAPAAAAASAKAVPVAPAVSMNAGDEIIEMDRMRKLIADHMVMSKAVSPHVTSFVEVDVTNMVLWRERVKKDFEKREGEKITFTPIIIEAVARAYKTHKIHGAFLYSNNNSSKTVEFTKALLNKIAVEAEGVEPFLAAFHRRSAARSSESDKRFQDICNLLHVATYLTYIHMQHYYIQNFHCTGWFVMNVTSIHM